MQVAINPYYLQVLEDMQNILKNSTPGKRRWTFDNVTGQPDYSQTERSTFPNWSKFFYEKTPKNKRWIYYDVNGDKPYQHGYYNGNTKELLNILNNSRNGYLSKSSRVRTAWIFAIHGYLEEVSQWEQENNENYYDYDQLKEFPF